MLDLVRQIRDRKTNRFDFHFYVQLPLAFIFLSAKMGDMPTALAALQTYRGWKVTEDIRLKLAKLVQDTDPMNGKLGSE